MRLRFYCVLKILENNVIGRLRVLIGIIACYLSLLPVWGQIKSEALMQADLYPNVGLSDSVQVVSKVFFDVNALKVSTKGERLASIRTFIKSGDQKLIFSYRKEVKLNKQIALQEEEKNRILIKEISNLGMGRYFLSGKIEDQVSGLSDTLLPFEVVVQPKEGKVGLSSITFYSQIFNQSQQACAEMFKHRNFCLMPYEGDFFGRETGSLKAYFEVTNADVAGLPDSLMAIRWKFLDFNNKKVLSDYGTISRHKLSGFVAISREFDISQLGSGQYIIQAEVLNAKGELVGLREKSFFRSNPMADRPKIMAENDDFRMVSTAGTFVANMVAKDLNEHLSHAIPVASKAESNTIEILLKGNETEAKRSFLLEFWQRRSPKNPEITFGRHQEKVKEAISRFGERNKTVGENERIKIYLKHGKPNQIFNENTDPVNQGGQNLSTSQYEIWQYYTLEATGQTTVEFVFLKDRYEGGGFRLVHSNARGETQNMMWRTRLR